MQSRVIVRRGINIPPEDKVNKAIEELGEGWRVVKAETSLAVFGIIPDSGMPPLHHCVYVTTVVMQKD